MVNQEHPNANAAPRWLPGLKPGRRQLVIVICLALVMALMLKPLTYNSYLELAGEALFVGLVLLFAFNAAGSWRQRWLPPWVAQLLAIALAAALAPLLVQMLTVRGDFSAFLRSRALLAGYWMVFINALIIGTLFALGALYRERNAQARAQVLQFALERETLLRQAADARLHLLTAQIEPHFLLNTLANVQELVESGSPQAAPVFRSLIAYLRSAMAQLQQETATLGDEERLVRSYLELMLMRMPDRLKFQIDIAPEARPVRFPAMALLTLVENAIRHGIDPACDGGTIDIGARLLADHTVQIWVADSGVGMSETAGPGTGLTNLRERLQASFGPTARLDLSEQSPHGVRAELRFVAPRA